MKTQTLNNISNEEYHNSAKYKHYWSSSNIKAFLKSPMHAYYEKFEAENESTPAMRTGTLIHDFFEHKIFLGSNFYK